MTDVENKMSGKINMLEKKMDETELRINLKALKNIDPYIIDIEEHSSQVNIIIGIQIPIIL